MIPNSSGVYSFYNPVNGKIYIGSSNNLRQRYANYKSQSKKNTIGKPPPCLHNVFNKYGFENIEFKVLLLTEDYREWEEVLIRLLNPEYNISVMVDGKLKPNLGKKFNSQWVSKIKRRTPHDKETKRKLTFLNKQNACKLKFSKDGTVHKFNSWVEASKYFKVSGSAIQNAFKEKGSWREWKIERLTRQKKKVKLTQSNLKELLFDSSYACDKYLNLWRGATSHAIRNMEGRLHQHKVEYI